MLGAVPDYSRGSLQIFLSLPTTHSLRTQPFIRVFCPQMICTAAMFSSTIYYPSRCRGFQVGRKLRPRARLHFLSTPSTRVGFLALNQPTPACHAALSTRYSHPGAEPVQWSRQRQPTSFECQFPSGQLPFLRCLFQSRPKGVTLRSRLPVSWLILLGGHYASHLFRASTDGLWDAFPLPRASSTPEQSGLPESTALRSPVGIFIRLPETVPRQELLPGFYRHAPCGLCPASPSSRYAEKSQCTRRCAHSQGFTLN